MPKTIAENRTSHLETNILQTQRKNPHPGNINRPVNCFNKTIFGFGIFLFCVFRHFDFFWYCFGETFKQENHLGNQTEIQATAFKFVLKIRGKVYFVFCFNHLPIQKKLSLSPLKKRLISAYNALTISFNLTRAC